MSESNNNIPMRITQLEEATAYEDGMYYAVAKAGSGTKKINVDAVSDGVITKLSYIGAEKITDESLTWRNGFYYTSLGTLTSADYAKTSSAIKLNAGDTIDLFARMYASSQCVLMISDASGNPTSYIYVGDGNFNEYIYTATSECYVIFSYWLAQGYKCIVYRSNKSIKNEVEDIRIGSDGVTYSSAGDAVRGQINYLKQQLGIEEKKASDFTWRDGYFATSLVNLVESEYTKTSNAIKLNAGDKIEIFSRMYNETQCVLMLSNSSGTPYEYIYLGDGTYKEYTYTATEDCYVIFTYWISYGFKCTLYHASAITKKEYVVAKSGGDFDSFTDCLYSLANDSSEKTIYVQSGVYDIYEELGGDDFIASITDPEHTSWRDVNPIVPPNTHIIGRGNVILEFKPTAQQIGSQAMAVLFSPLNIQGNCTIENINIDCTNCRYAIHDESSGLEEFNDNVHKYINVKAHKEKGTYGYNPTYAAGVGARSRWYFENCIFTSDIGICWTTHTTTSAASDLAAITFNNCIFDSDNGTPNSGMVQFLVGGGAHLALKNDVFLSGCYINGGIFVTPNGTSGLNNKYALTLVGNKLVNSITIDPTFENNPYTPKVYTPLS